MCAKGQDIQVWTIASSTSHDLVLFQLASAIMIDALIIDSVS